MSMLTTGDRVNMSAPTSSFLPPLPNGVLQLPAGSSGVEYSVPTEPVSGPTCAVNLPPPAFNFRVPPPAPPFVYRNFAKSLAPAAAVPFSPYPRMEHANYSPGCATAPALTSYSHGPLGPPPGFGDRVVAGGSHPPYLPGANAVIPFIVPFPGGLPAMYIVDNGANVDKNCAMERYLHDAPVFCTRNTFINNQMYGNRPPPMCCEVMNTAQGIAYDSE